MSDSDLRHHGDVEADLGLLDFATNVRLTQPPEWLRARLRDALGTLGRYPTVETAREAVARRHGRSPLEVLLTAGAAEAFVLIAQSLRPTRAICLHPSFTEPEFALRAAGHAVERVLLPDPFLLDPAGVPADADLVVFGNPTNPTSVMHPLETVEALAQPGRLLVVDEAFADCIPREPASIASRSDVPGAVVVRSLTKTWGVSGLRAGYLLADRAMILLLSRAQQAWPVSTLAAIVIEECVSAHAIAEAERWAHGLITLRAQLADALHICAGVRVVAGASASFLLFHSDDGVALRKHLRNRGIAVRRGDTFPGLGVNWTRVAVRDEIVNARLAAAVATAAIATSRSP
jgi:histidinol-phosphate aminotransferase